MGKCIWASIDERGKAKGGDAGDQTGKEVKTGSWYNFNQTQILFWKDVSLAKKYVAALKYFASSNLVGYDQSERTTLYNELAKVKWKYPDLKVKVETDCSSLVLAAVNCAVGKKLITSAANSSTMKSILMNTGLFAEKTGSRYKDSGDYLALGAILIAPGNHVISAIENGSKYGISNSIVAESTLSVGSTGSEVKKLQRNLNKLNFTDSAKNPLVVDGKFGASTKEALKKFQKKYGLTVDGIYGVKSEKKMAALFS